MPEHWSLFKKAFEKGRKSKPVEDLKWFKILEMPVSQLQQQILING